MVILEYLRLIFYYQNGFRIGQNDSKWFKMIFSFGNQIWRNFRKWVQSQNDAFLIDPVIQNYELMMTSSRDQKVDQTWHAILLMSRVDDVTWSSLGLTGSKRFKKFIFIENELFVMISNDSENGFKIKHIFKYDQNPEIVELNPNIFFGR